MHSIRIVFALVALGFAQLPAAQSAPSPWNGTTSTTIASYTAGSLTSLQLTNGTTTSTDPIKESMAHQQQKNHYHRMLSLAEQQLQRVFFGTTFALIGAMFLLVIFWSCNMSWCCCTPILLAPGHITRPLIVARCWSWLVALWHCRFFCHHEAHVPLPPMRPRSQLVPLNQRPAGLDLVRSSANTPGNPEVQSSLV